MNVWVHIRHRHPKAGFYTCSLQDCVPHKPFGYKLGTGTPKQGFIPVLGGNVFHMNVWVQGRVLLLVQDLQITRKICFMNTRVT